MQFPFAIHIGTNLILLHTILEPIAFFAGFRYFLYLKMKNGDWISSENRTWIIIAAIFGALLGSRLVGGLENPEELLNSNNLLLYFYRNKTILGGLLGGLFAVEFVKWIVKEKNSSGDLFVYPIILAMIIGRIGCFSMGVFEETYGTTTSFPTGMNLGDNLMRHPIVLYEIIFLTLLWGWLKFIDIRFSLRNGSLFKLFMIAYVIFRFFLEFIKPRYIISIGMSSVQIASLLGLLWYIRYLMNPKKFFASRIGSKIKVYA